MGGLFYFGLMLAAGISVALQPIINANLAARVGTVQSSFISFTVGAAVLGVAVIFYGHGSLRDLPGVPWWQLTGGALGALFVTALIVAVP
ncbi:MAG: DMT family transporter, partial [Nitrospirota bacterium]